MFLGTNDNNNNGKKKEGKRRRERTVGSRGRGHKMMGNDGGRDMEAGPRTHPATVSNCSWGGKLGANSDEGGRMGWGAKQAQVMTESFGPQVRFSSFFV